METRDYKSRVAVGRGSKADRGSFISRKFGRNRKKYGPQPAVKNRSRLFVVLAAVALSFLVVYSLIKWLRGGGEKPVAVAPVSETAKTIPLPVPSTPLVPVQKAPEKKPVIRAESANKSQEAATVAVPLPDPAVSTIVPAPAPVKKPEPPAPIVRVKPPEPRFTFYKILPDQEVIIPEQDIRMMKQNVPSASVQYTVQVGSSLQLDEAKKLQEKLSQIKVKSQVESVEIDNALWYRVKVGPFKGLDDADKVRLWLRHNKIDSIVQQQKKLEH